jgi:hypothetical protein
MTSRTSELETRAILNEWALARYQGGLRNSRLAVEPSPTGAGGRNERPARANLEGVLLGFLPWKPCGSPYARNSCIAGYVAYTQRYEA